MMKQWVCLVAFILVQGANAQAPSPVGVSLVYDELVKLANCESASENLTLSLTTTAVVAGVTYGVWSKAFSSHVRYELSVLKSVEGLLGRYLADENVVIKLKAELDNIKTYYEFNRTQFLNKIIESGKTILREQGYPSQLFEQTMRSNPEFFLEPQGRLIAAYNKPQYKVVLAALREQIEMYFSQRQFILENIDHIEKKLSVERSVARLNGLKLKQKIRDHISLFETVEWSATKNVIPTLESFPEFWKSNKPVLKKLVQDYSRKAFATSIKKFVGIGIPLVAVAAFVYEDAQTDRDYFGGITSEALLLKDASRDQLQQHAQTLIRDLGFYNAYHGLQEVIKKANCN